MPVNTRALSPEEAKIVQTRMQELLAAPGATQQSVGDNIGISQQMVGKIARGGSVPGLYAAKRLAAYDRIPVDMFLAGIPRPLYEAIQAGRKRWAESTISAVTSEATTRRSMRSFTSEMWTDLLDRTQEALDPVMRHPKR